MTGKNTLYWHDYETFGSDPHRDRPVQFAGLRTSEELEVVGDPLVVYCRPPDDLLPQPDACLVTGITPQLAAREGVTEAEFAARIHRELSRPKTCGVGYNSIRFDDEVTRFLLYRNFYDAYAREWQHGNSRWDIIDVLRLTHALRPEGMEWPLKEDGTPSFRLEDLTVANGIEHGSAHDALADVRATIALARRVRDRQRRLYDYAYTHRSKQAIAPLLDPQAPKPVLHTSSRYPASYGCTALVAPVARHPVNNNGVVVFDLRYEPEPLLTLPVEELRERLYTPVKDLPEGVEHLPLKLVHINKAPVVAPLGVLDPASAERLHIDVAAGRERLARLRAAPDLEARVAALYEPRDWPQDLDPEQALYGGGFFNDRDRALAEQVRRVPPSDLAVLEGAFRDPRLPELLFRYRARNYPETLTADERGRWQAFRRKRLTDPEGGGGITLDTYRERLDELRARFAGDDEKLTILAELEAWGKVLGV